MKKIKCITQHPHPARHLVCTPLLDIASNAGAHPIHAYPIKICEGFCDYPKICIISIALILVVKCCGVKRCHNATELRNTDVEEQFASVETTLYAVQWTRTSTRTALNAVRATDLLHWIACGAVRFQKNYTRTANYEIW